MENTTKPELNKRTSNQAARDRKKSRRQQWLNDKKALEDEQENRILELQTAIQTVVQQQVDSSVRHFEDESKRQEQLIRELRDEILLLQGKVDSGLWDKLKQFLENYIGVPVHIYPTEIGAHSHYIDSLKELEQRRKHPLRSDDPDFPTAQTTFIHENGLHLGIEQKILDVLWEVQITPWDAFTPDERNRIQAALKIMMDYTRTTPAITLNSSQNLKNSKQQKSGQGQNHEDEVDGNAQQFKKHGKMYAAGWHGTRGERGIDVARYTVRRQGSASNRTRILGEYTRTTEGFAFVGEQYAKRLSNMFPRQCRVLSDFALENHIPSFADMEIWLAGGEAQTPFANSLTITNGDFANYVHRDRDAIDIAFGMWWTASRENQRQPWTINEEYDHDCIKGGEFLIAEYGIAVDFPKTKGLVEIFWRGKKDYHVTMQSDSPPRLTRFGTSVQITQSAVRGMRALQRHGLDPARVVGHEDRVNGAEEAISDIE